MSKSELPRPDNARLEYQGVPEGERPLEPDAKLSEGLRAEMSAAREGDTRIDLHMVLKRGLSRSELQKTLARISGLSSDKDAVRVWKGTDVVASAVPLKAVSSLAEMSEVVWVDIEHTAPMEHLLD